MPIISSGAGASAPQPSGGGRIRPSDGVQQQGGVEPGEGLGASPDAQLQAMGVQVLASEDQAGLQAVRRRSGVAPDGLSALDVSQVGIQLLGQEGSGSALDAARRRLSVAPQGLTALQVASVGLQVLGVPAEGAGLQGARRRLSVAPELGPSVSLQVPSLGVQVLGTGIVEEPEPPLPEVDPTTPFFLANWVGRFGLRESWATGEGRSDESGKLEHTSLIDRPRRLATFRWLFTNNRQSDTDLRLSWRRMYDMLGRLTSERTLLPLYPDVAEITGETVVDGEAVFMTSTTVFYTSTEVFWTSAYGGSDPEDYTFDLAGKRFYPNKAVAIFRRKWNLHLDPSSVVYAIIDKVNTETGEISFKGEIPSFDFDGPFTYWVVPLIWCEPAARPVARELSPEIVSVEISAKEVFGPTALPSFVPPASVPLPYWDIAPDHGRSVTSGFERELVSDRQGRDIITETTGGRGRHYQRWELTSRRSEWASNVMPIWDGVRGRWRPVGVSEQSELAKVVGAAGDLIFFVPDDTEQFDAATFNSFQARVLSAGFVVLQLCPSGFLVRRALQVENLITTWAVRVAVPVPTLSTDDIERGYPGRIYYFDNDTVDQDWLSPDIVRMSFGLIEDELPGDVEIL